MPARKKSAKIDMGKRYANATNAGPIFAYVKDGKLVRIEPLHFEEEEVKSWEINIGGKVYKPPLKCPLINWGHTYRKYVESPNRTKYPYKRVDWDPNGERNPQNRGRSGYVRISWEEALDIIANEIKRVQKAYGPGAVMALVGGGHSVWGALHFALGDFFRFFQIVGSTVSNITPNSWEGWFAGASFMYGHFAQQGILPAPDSLQDISEHSELIVLWGTDQITHNMYHGIDTARTLFFWKELGKKVILIEPFFNDTGVAFADKWIPVIPGTDAAMAAAIAYLWITEKAYDQGYLDTHTIGFDEEHLPPGAPAGTSFKSYILGTSDGVPKTPKWSEQITGVPARVITELAREWASKPTTLSAMWGGTCRRAYAHEWARFMVTLQAMQGLGKPGVCLIAGLQNLCGPYDKRQIGPLGYADAAINAVAEKVYVNPVKQILTENLASEAILHPPVKWHGGESFTPDAETFFKEHEYPMPEDGEIHMILARGSSHFTPPNQNRWIEVYQSPKIETIIVQDPWFNRECRFADIVLPVSMTFEQNDLTEPGKVGQYVPAAIINVRCAVYQKKCLEPVGESKTDLEIYAELAKRMGVGDEYTEGNTEEDWMRKLYRKTNIPMSYEEFKEKGYYVWPFLPDYKPCKQLKVFYENPEKERLATPSGKIEIFSQALFERYGAYNPEIPPVPHYIEEWEGRYTKPLVDRYPLQLLTPHPKFRYHGKYSDIGWLREIYKVKGPDGYEYEPIYMSPADAAERGLRDGDIVRVFNDRGQILCGIRATERLLKGVVSIAYGSWWDLLEPKAGAIDRGGYSDFLTPNRGMSAHHIGFAYNSTLVEVEKADLEELSKKYPEGWAGKYRTWSKE